ncbi:MAG: preprotein translocase subunit SecE [Planctomycetaceae bacterium]
MAEARNGRSLWGGLLAFDLYKRNQGRLVRQVTAITVAVIVIIGAWTLSRSALLMNEQRWARIGIPLAVSILGGWAAFRLVNWPRFADFLISVEAEIDKVSWPSRQELKRASMVVISTMFVLGAILFLYDMFWLWLFKMLNILHG